MESKQKAVIESPIGVIRELSRNYLHSLSLRSPYAMRRSHISFIYRYVVSTAHSS